MTNILLISGDVVNQNMGGTGVRNWELANALAEHHQVTMAIPNQTEIKPKNFHLHTYDFEKGDLRPYASRADMIILHGMQLHFHSYLRELGLPMAVDMYVPYLLENLVWHDQDDWSKWIPEYEEYLRIQLELLRAGDFFFCASERQRDYWLGWLHAQKRINPHTYRQDPTLRKLIDVVPFGLPDGRPTSTRPVMKGVIPGISMSDKVILWSGGLWDWLDPLLLIRAVAKLAASHTDYKLYFMGTHHPNPIVRGMAMPDRAVALSKELNIFNTTVFFGDWVPYAERENYLAEADLSVISHPAHIETHFSFRTRALDSIWAGLPLIVTHGDAMADWVENERLGATVPPGDVAAMATAIEGILSKGKKAYSDAFDDLREKLRWGKVITPLLDWCKKPAFAADKGHYLTETERMARDKDAYLDMVIKDKEETLDRYRRLLPFRIYRLFKRFLGR
jgi:glycosyltransferase involved in cell wall biosynthesis